MATDIRLLDLAGRAERIPAGKLRGSEAVLLG